MCRKPRLIYKSKRTNSYQASSLESRTIRATGTFIWPISSRSATSIGNYGRSESALHLRSCKMATGVKRWHISDRKFFGLDQHNLLLCVERVAHALNVQTEQCWTDRLLSYWTHSTCMRWSAWRIKNNLLGFYGTNCQTGTAFGQQVWHACQQP